MPNKLKITLEMIKVEHTIFALPFAFLGAFLAARGLPTIAQCAWILLAMIGARSAAMAFNRLVDERFDAQNPRTAGRALPRKLVTRSFVILFVVLSAAILIFAASQLNALALKLSPVALVVVFFYSYTKRFTWLSHLFLGISLACAPVGAWIAIKGSMTTTPLLLGLVVVLWVAGFDIIYACQDIDFDHRAALHSIPQRFGTKGALWISGILHLMMIGLLALLLWQENLQGLSIVGLALVTVLLFYQHSLVKPSDLSRANTAFFTLNGWISILLFAATSIDLICCRSSLP